MGRPQTIPLNQSTAVCINPLAGFQRLASEAEARFAHARSISAVMAQVKEMHALEERDLAAVGNVIHMLISEGMDLHEAARRCVVAGASE